MNYRLHARTLQVKVLMFNLQLCRAIKNINNFSLFQPVAESSHSPERFAPFHQGRKIRFVITDLLYYWIFIFLLLTLSSEWSLQNLLEVCRRLLCRHDCRSRETSPHVDLLTLSLHLDESTEWRPCVSTFSFTSWLHSWAARSSLCWLAVLSVVCWWSVTHGDSLFASALCSSSACSTKFEALAICGVAVNV